MYRDLSLQSLVKMTDSGNAQIRLEKGKKKQKGGQ
jgi:hypothetical protein